MGAHQEPTGQVLEGISVMASPIAPVSFTVEVSVVPFGPEHFDGGCAGRGEAMAAHERDAEPCLRRLQGPGRLRCDGANGRVQLTGEPGGIIRFIVGWTKEERFRAQRREDIRYSAK